MDGNEYNTESKDENSVTEAQNEDSATEEAKNDENASKADSNGNGEVEPVNNDIPEPPPVNNDHVADGAIKFDEPAQKHRLQHLTLEFAEYLNNLAPKDSDDAAAQILHWLAARLENA